MGFREIDVSGVWPSGNRVAVSVRMTRAFAASRRKIHR